MIHTGEIPMPEVVFEVEPEVRAQQIYEVTGIRPDSRYFIPLEETRKMVTDVQSGDESAMEHLIAAKIVPIYKYVQKKPEIRERPDLHLSDVLQMGSLALTEAALKANPELTWISTKLYVESIRGLGKMLTDGKLVPAVGSYENAILEGAIHGEEGRFLDQVALVNDEDELSELASIETETYATRSRVRSETEEKAMLHDASERLLKGRSDREKYILARRFGLADVATGRLREIGQELGVSTARINAIEQRALDRIRMRYGGLPSQDMAEKFLVDWLPDL